MCWSQFNSSICLCQTHINSVVISRKFCILSHYHQSARKHEHCNFPFFSLLLVLTHTFPFHSAPSRLFMHFSHNHLTFLSLAKGYFRGSFTLLGFPCSQVLIGNFSKVFPFTKVTVTRLEEKSWNK